MSSAAEIEKAIADYKKKRHNDSSLRYYQQNREEIIAARRKKERPIDPAEERAKSHQPYMEDAEIVRSYNNALHPAKQIKILAQLNDVTVATIEAVLMSHGVLKRKRVKQ